MKASRLRSPKKDEAESWRKQESYDPTDDEPCTFEIHESDDLDVLWRMSLQTQESHLKGKEESESHILQRLKELHRN
jgi:hypothetical protein